MSEQILLISYHSGGIKMCVYSSDEKHDNFRKVSVFWKHMWLVSIYLLLVEHSPSQKSENDNLC